MNTLALCRHCMTPYHPDRSHSGLKLTYCGILCEAANLGFTLDSIIKMEPSPKPLSLDELFDAHLAATIDMLDDDLAYAWAEAVA